LCYLSVNGARQHAREKLAGQLWPDLSAERGRGALKTALWRLRHEIEPEGVTRGRFLTVTPGEIGLNWSDALHCDATDLYAVLKRAEAARDGSVMAALEADVDLMVGDLLEGYYDDWILIERARLTAARSRALYLLMGAARDAGQTERALVFGQRILEADPLRESIHRAVIRLHLVLNQRGQALRQFETCKRLLRDELGIAPMPETTVLLAEINARRPVAASPSASEAKLRDAMVRVEDAMARLAQSHANLSQQLDRLDAAPPGG
jgi:DNA-binding SARP family transcriptional activator